MITQPNWQSLASGVVVLARPAALWTRAVDYIAGPRKLKIVTDPASKWTLSAGNILGPDGDPAQSQNSAAPPLLPSALIGALICKIGGSAADNPAPVLTAGGTAPVAPIGIPVPISIGSFCIVELAATQQKGSLFLTMNDAPAAFSQHAGQLSVEIFEAL
jgi:hypothetical protein